MPGPCSGFLPVKGLWGPGRCRVNKVQLRCVRVCVCAGIVYNYTEDGVRRDQTGWERCVSIPLVRPDMFHLLAQWDQYLESFSEGSHWDPLWHK